MNYCVNSAMLPAQFVNLSDTTFMKPGQKLIKAGVYLRLFGGLYIIGDTEVTVHHHSKKVKNQINYQINFLFNQLTL